jgi:hypothetical protein
MKRKLAFGIVLAVAVLVFLPFCNLTFDLDAPTSSLNLTSALVVYEIPADVQIQFSFTAEQDKHLCQYSVAKNDGTSFFVVDEGEVELLAGVMYKHTDISSYSFENGHYRFSVSVLLERNGGYDSPPFLQESVDFWIDPTGPSGEVTIVPSGGPYSSAQQVVLEHPEIDAIDGTPARIFYTTDGSDPTSSSTEYLQNHPITVSANTTLKAVAIDMAGRSSDISSAIYKIDIQAPIQPVASPGSGAYAVNAVDLTHPEYPTSANGTPVTIFYTIDGSAPDALSSEYSGTAITFPVDGVWQLRAIAVDGAGNASTEMVAKYTIDTNAPDEPSIISPSGSGNYDTDFDLSITHEDIPAGTQVQIYYTVDGSTPDRSANLYTGPVNISSNTEIKAIAIDQVGNESSVVSETYTFLRADSITDDFCSLDGEFHFFDIAGYFGIFFDNLDHYIPGSAGIYLTQGSAQVDCVIVYNVSTKTDLIIQIDSRRLLDESMIPGDATITISSNINLDSDSVPFELR